MLNYMNCSICCETFINPKDYTREEFEELFKEKTTTHNEITHNEIIYNEIIHK